MESFDRPSPTVEGNGAGIEVRRAELASAVREKLKTTIAEIQSGALEAEVGLEKMNKVLSSFDAVKYNIFAAKDNLVFPKTVDTFDIGENTYFVTAKVTELGKSVEMSVRNIKRASALDSAKDVSIETVRGLVDTDIGIPLLPRTEDEENAEALENAFKGQLESIMTEVQSKLTKAASREKEDEIVRAAKSKIGDEMKIWSTGSGNFDKPIEMRMVYKQYLQTASGRKYFMMAHKFTNKEKEYKYDFGIELAG